MVTATPPKQKSEVSETQISPKGSNNFKFLYLFLIVFGTMIFFANEYEKIVKIGPDGNPILSKEREKELIKRQQKNLSEAEQYILIAIDPGYRECYLCPEKKVWLETGEIAKIGFSTNGISRYSIAYYEKHRVYYRVEYRGDLTTAKNKEIERLGSYPLLPENQKREKKLVYPPLNSKLD